MEVIEAVKRIDNGVNERIEQNQMPVISRAMESLTGLGSVHLSVLFVIILWSFGQIEAAKMLGTGYVAAWIPIYALKHAVRRERPEHHIEHVVGRDSFPSGHSGTSFVAAVILGSLYSREWIFLPLAVIIAFSRVYLEDHYLSDAISGSLIGIVAGLLVTSGAIL